MKPPPSFLRLELVPTHLRANHIYVGIVISTPLSLFMMMLLLLLLLNSGSHRLSMVLVVGVMVLTRRWIRYEYGTVRYGTVVSLL